MNVLCEVCNETTSKYKCSKCFCPYCSLNCWKKHNDEDNCRVKKLPEENSQVQSSRTKYFTEDTVGDDKLSQLGQSETLKKILKNKYLQSSLTTVDNAPNPEEAIHLAMKDPEFVEFVDECLKIVEDSND